MRHIMLLGSQQVHECQTVKLAWQQQILHYEHDCLFLLCSKAGWIRLESLVDLYNFNSRRSLGKTLGG